MEISIHAPPRGATKRKSYGTASHTLFQFTPLREGRQVTLKSKWKCIQISIHAPPRGATRLRRSRTCLLAFQFTPLREGRREARFNGALTSAFQFTPLREGRPYFLSSTAIPYAISIHAPPRGATTPARRTRNAYHFNSRPSARGDSMTLVDGTWMDAFQFTPLREGRRGGVAADVQERGISIHAPPRGATRLAHAFVPPACYFNSRPSARGDILLRRCFIMRMLFQFTPLREGRPLRFSFPHATRVFQFTPLREGRRAMSRTVDAFLEISIHAPPRGATA